MRSHLRSVDHQSVSEKQDIFRLSNGARLRFKLISQRDPMFLRTWDVRALRPGKDDLVLGLCTARYGQEWHSAPSELQLFCADFDRLPPGYDTGNPRKDWTRFRRDLARLFGARAIVTGSRSGRAKIFFCIRVLDPSPDLKVTRQAGLDMLSKVIPDYLYEYVDNTYSGIFESFLTKQMVGALLAGLPNLKPAATLDSLIQPSLGTCSEIEFKRVQVKKKLRVYNGPLPGGFEFFIGKRSPETKEKILRTLLACKGLITERGFDLVQAKLAEVAGISVEQVRKYLKQLQEQGLLECINPKWKPGAKARTYRAKGTLADAIRAIHGDLTMRSRPDMPTSIPRKEWQSTLWEFAKYFVNDPAGYWAWFESLPGHDRDDHRRQAERALANRMKYAERAKVSVPAKAAS